MGEPINHSDTKERIAAQKQRNFNRGEAMIFGIKHEWRDWTISASLDGTDWLKGRYWRNYVLPDLDKKKDSCKTQKVEQTWNRTGWSIL
ncbi:MAG: hypothetical protein P8047_16125 [Gammaproteobacteria bacterium]